MFDNPYHVILGDMEYAGYGYCGPLSNKTLQEYPTLESAKTAACKMSNCYDGEFLVVYKYSGKVLFRVG